jgi:two-component system CheB/CheR fusion protein
MALVVIQHLDPKHPSMITEILARATRMPVTEVRNNCLVENNHIYVIQPNSDMVISSGYLRTFPRSETRGPHLPIDFFFQSLAQDKHAQSIGVVLSGTASDGARGIGAIKTEGGLTFAQDPKTAKYDGMPRTAIATGHVDYILSPKAISEELVRIAAHPYLFSTETPHQRESKEKEKPVKLGDALNTIFSLLLRASHVDFSRYKPTTIQRRIARRMVLLKIDNVATYATFLKQHPEEITALFNEILINVTEFFRDRDVFRALKAQVFPIFMANRVKGTPIRIWVPGCSTGEEAYSIAISLVEFLDERASQFPIQIFASDIDEPALVRARAGIYPEGIAKEVSKERLQRFFVKGSDERYHISKYIRDMCLFSKHDLTSDPPFAKMDLISCRNLLIYFDASLQKQVIPLLHYSLNPNGILWLGKSESVGGFQNLFGQIDKTNKFFAKKGDTTPARFKFPAGGFVSDRLQPTFEKPQFVYKAVAEAQRDADRLVLTKYGPPGSTVSDELEIIQFRGQTSPFLEPIPGQANLSLVKMLRMELLPEVRALVQLAKKQNKPARREGIAFEANGHVHAINIEVTPVIPNSTQQRDRYFLILFEPADLVSELPSPGKSRGGRAQRTVGQTGDKNLESLQHELKANKEHLQSLTEEYEATQEELTASNEELQSTNEELQSTNEELETAKEELQSTNEELTTVNEELQNRNVELSNLNNDLINLLGSVEIPILMVSNDHQIRRFTPKASKVLNVIPTDVGRPVGDIKPNIEVPDLDRLISDVIETMGVHESEVKSRDGKWFRLQIRPYRTADNKIDGAVLSLMDIDVIKRSLEEVSAAEKRYRALLESAHDAIVIIDERGSIEFVNKRGEDWFGYRSNEIVGQPLEMLMAERVRNAHAIHREKYLRAPQGRMDSSGLELIGLRKNGTEFPIDVSLSAVHLERGTFVTTIIRDVSEVKKREDERQALLAREQASRKEAEEANRTKDIFLATLSHELRTPLTAILSWTQLLQRAEMDKGSRLKKGLDAIENNAKAQGQLVNDLLDISRIMSGKLILEPRDTNPVEVLRAAVEMVRLQAEQKSQRLEVSLQNDGLIHVDPIRLQQILWNLLVNSIKFTPEKGTISVSFLSRAGKAIFTISDTGRGFSREFAPRLFEAFVQADASTTRKDGGLGLGLSLVKRLTDLQGGSVRAESSGVGQGATFTVEFPIRSSEQLSGIAGRAIPTPLNWLGSKASDPIPSLADIRILLVDDEKSTRQALSALLTELGAIVEVASSADQALDKLARSHPDVVTTDIAMPGMDGYMFLRKIRELESDGNRSVPVVAMTAFAAEQDRAAAIRAGFSAYLSKPLDIAHLATELVRVARKSTDQHPHPQA